MAMPAAGAPACHLLFLSVSLRLGTMEGRLGRAASHVSYLPYRLLVHKTISRIIRLIRSVDTSPTESPYLSSPVFTVRSSCDNSSGTTTRCRDRSATSLIACPWRFGIISIGIAALVLIIVQLNRPRRLFGWNARQPHHAGYHHCTEFSHIRQAMEEVGWSQGELERGHPNPANNVEAEIEGCAPVPHPGSQQQSTGDYRSKKKEQVVEN